MTTDGPKTSATIALTLLVLINLFNYIDRQILAAVESNIESTIFPESEYPRDPKTKERLDKTIEGKMGSLNTAFMVSYMLIAPIFGFLADRMSRWLLVAIGVVVWTLASGATGFAETFVVIFLTRCFVGVGEAAYGPVAPTVISDLFPVSKRGMIMAIFYMAIPVGSALGYVIGGQVTKLAGGDWRWAFYVVVPPGLLLGLWCLFMKEPPRGAADQGAVVRNARWADYLMVLKTPSYLLTTLGMTAMTFAMGGMAFFMPRFALMRIVGAEELEKLSQAAQAQLSQEGGTIFTLATRALEDMDAQEKAARLADVNTIFGIIVVVSGIGATVLGGIAGDKLKSRIPGAYFLVSAIAMALAFPFVLASIWAPFPMAWLYIFLACFCLFFNTGPTNTILANVTHPSIRASAFALNILIIHALGDAISPLVIGLVNGYVGGGEMTPGFLTVSVMCLVASICWFAGIKHLQRDTELAPTRLAE